MNSTNTSEGFLRNMRYTPEQREAMHEQARLLDEEGNALLTKAFELRNEMFKYENEVK